MEEFTIYYLKQQINTGQAYKLVNKYISALKTDHECNLKVSHFFNQIENDNIFDLSVKLCIIDGLKLKEELMKCLLCQDPYQVKRLIKCKWFFQYGFEAEHYINHVFPVVSVSTRCKLANALSKNILNAKEAETFYMFFGQNYNRDLAEIFLPKCSKEFILRALKQHPLNYSNNRNYRIIKAIYDQYQDIGMNIIENMFRDTKLYKKLEADRSVRVGSNNYNPYILSALLKHIANKDISKYIDNYDQYNEVLMHHCHKIGQKRTKKLVVMFHTKIVKKPGLYLNSLNKKKLMKYLNNEGKITLLTNYIKTLPVTNYNVTSNWPMFEENLHRLKIFEQMKPMQKLDLYLQVYKQSYDKNLMDCPNSWSKRFLELLPSNQREECVNVLLNLKIVKENELQSYTYLFEPSKVIEAMILKLKKEPDGQKRELYLLTMVDSCAIDQDINSLETVCNYFLARHQNENDSLLFNFTSKIFTKFKFERRVAIATKLYEQMTAVKLGERGVCSLFDNKFHSDLFEYKYKNNLDYSKELKKFSEFLIREVSGTKLYGISKPALRFITSNRTLFNEIINTARQVYLELEDSEAKVAIFMGMFDLCNRNNRKNKINIDDYPWVLEMIESLINKNQNQYFDISDFILYPNILTGKQNKHFSELLLKFEKYEKKLLTHMLLINPKLLKDKMGNIIIRTVGTHQEMHFQGQYLKIFHFLNMKKELLYILHKHFEDQDITNVRNRLLHISSFYSDTETFLSLYNKYVPQGENIDYMTENNLLQISIKFVKCIKHLRPITNSTLQLLQSFLFRDFLRYGHNSLVHLVHHSQVEFIKPFLYNNLNKPVSVKKRIIKLIGEVSTIDERIQFFNDHWDKENHYSAQNELVKMVTRCFISRKSETVWPLVTKCIKECDFLNLPSIPPIFEVPDCYLKEYVEVVWARYEQPTDVNYRSQKKENFLSSFTDKIFLIIGSEFPINILQKYLFVEQETCQCNVEMFACNYLRFLSEQQHFNFEFLVNIIKDRINNVKEIQKFYRYLCERVVLHPFENDDRYFNQLLQIWYSHFSPFKHTKFHFYLNLNRMYIESRVVHGNNRQQLSHDYGVQLRQFYIEMEYHKDLLPILLDCLSDVFRKYRNAVQIISLVDLLDGMLQDTGNSDGNILAAIILSKFGQINDKNIKEFLPVMDRLKTLNNPVINMYLF